MTSSINLSRIINNVFIHVLRLLPANPVQALRVKLNGYDRKIAVGSDLPFHDNCRHSLNKNQV